MTSLVLDLESLSTVNTAFMNLLQSLLERYVQAQSLTCRREEETFEVVYVIEFNRARKRIPILVHALPGEFQLLIKGPDIFIL